MELTRKQEEGRKIIVNKYLSGEPFGVVSGYAGVGKSVCISFIVASLGLDPEEDVCYACPTGKACNQLQKLGHRNVTTLHKLLWKYKLSPKGYFTRFPVEIGDIPYKLIVVDEVSMVPQETIEQLLKHHIFILFCGDPFQLPPPSDEPRNTLLEKPDVFLDEVMRQAKESDIIRLSMVARAKQPIGYYKGNDLMILPKKELHEGHLAWADQILVGLNDTRKGINQHMREMRGFEGEAPQIGDKVIVRRNYHETFGNNGFSLVNGTIGFLEKAIYPCAYSLPRALHIPGGPLESYKTNFVSDYSEDYGYLKLDKQMLLTGEYRLTLSQQVAISKFYKKIGAIQKPKQIIPMEFEYGYAITVHSSQGSSWDKVLLLEETFPQDWTEHCRWVYTGITRSCQKLIMIKGDF